MKLSFSTLTLLKLVDSSVENETTHQPVILSFKAELPYGQLGCKKVWRENAYGKDVYGKLT